MKGKTYSGIGWLPSHPDADLHGLVRLVIRHSNWAMACDVLSRNGIPHPSLNSRVWQESKSVAEVFAGEQHFGELLVCPIIGQYLDAARYRPLRKGSGVSGQNPKAKTGIPPADWRRK